MNKNLLRGLAVAVLLFGAMGLQAPTMAAPTTLTITQPDGSGDVAGDGDDYFTRVLGDPNDFDNPEDVYTPQYFSNISMSGGVWKGTTTAIDASIMLLFPGFASTAQGLTSRTGRVYPISSSRYSHLIVKYHASAATSAIVYWMPEGEPYGNPSLIGNSRIFPVPAGDNIMDFDLTLTGGGAGGPAWTSRPTWGGLRFDPAQFSPGVTVELDWVRLVPATDNTARQRLAWTCPECAGTFPDIIADTDTDDSNGYIKLLLGASGGAGQAQVPVGKLAAGDYYLGILRSGQPTVYSPGTFTVQPAPRLKINSPGPSSGEDYATTYLGHSWDMTSPDYIAGTENIGNLHIGDSIFQGGALNDDPTIFLLRDNGPAIDTSRYKYLTFNEYLEYPGTSDFAITRALWQNSTGTVGLTADIVHWYNRWTRYEFDMSTTQLAPAALAWDGSLTTLRLDPNEHPAVNLIKLGPVRLTATPQTAIGQQYAISWQAAAITGTVDLYYATDRTSNGTQLAADVPIANGGYIWQVPNTVTPGTYWIRAVADDGLVRTTWYSPTPLIITTPITAFNDVTEGNPFVTFIQDLLDRGIVEGYLNGDFAPFGDAKRGTLARWVVKSQGWSFDLTGAPHFSDVAPTDPDYPYIETAYNHGVLSGYSPGACSPEATIGCFKPENNLTRGQMSKMIVNAFGWTIDTSGGPHFSDVHNNGPDDTNPFYGQIETIVNHGAVSGYADGTFRWGNSLTRGQLTKVLSNSLLPASK